MIQLRRGRYCVRDSKGKLHKFASESEALALLQGDLPVAKVEESHEEEESIEEEAGTDE